MRKILAVACLVCLLALSADAATTPNSIITAQTPNRGLTQFLQGTDAAGTYKTLYTAGANGSKCNAVWGTTNDGTVTHVITLQILNGGHFYGGNAVTLALSAGFNGTNAPSQTIMPMGLPNDSDNNPYIQLISGDTLAVTFATALTAGTLINVVASCADY
jgi:hypothetical protein